MRRVSPRLWGLLTVLVSVVLLGACGSPPPQPKPTPTVGPQGFEVSLGPVTVSGPPGVAADGVTARIEPAPRPDAVVPLTYTPAAEPFAITMSDDSQPRQPVTVRLRIDEEQPGVLAFVLQDSRTGRWEGIPVTMNQREATVTIEHFSTGFFAWLDRSKVGRAGADLGEGVNDYLGARPEPPDCVNQTVTINGRVYAASIDNPQLYACVTKRDGRAVVSVHPGSPHVWRLTANVTEAKVGQSRVPLGAAEALTLAAFRLEHPGSVGYQTLLVPRGQEEFILADTATTATIDATMEPRYGLISVPSFAVEQYLTASGIRLNPLDEVQNLDCVADLVEFSKDPTKSAGGLLGPVAGCLGQQAKDPAASLTLGLLASALPQLSTQFTGLTGLAAGKDTAKITVTSDTAAAFPLGAWSGPITQPGARPFSINVTVTGTPGAYAATVEYPGLGCSGRWTYQGVEGSAILFLEQIDSDPQRTCVATVPIRFAPNPDGSVSYTALNSTGTLRRGSSTPGAASTPGGQGDAATAGWPTHRNDDGAGIRIWLGAAATSGESHVGVPKWISCKDASLCLAGSNQKVGLIGRRTGGYYTIAEFPPTQPAGPALAAAGVSAADIESLLR